MEFDKQVGETGGTMLSKVFTKLASQLREVMRHQRALVAPPAPTESDVADSELFAAVRSRLMKDPAAAASRALTDLIRALYLDGSAFYFENLAPLDAADRKLAAALIQAKLADTYPLETWENVFRFSVQCQKPEPKNEHHDAVATPAIVEHEASGAAANVTAEALMNEVKAAVQTAKADSLEQALAHQPAPPICLQPSRGVAYRLWALLMTGFIGGLVVLAIPMGSRIQGWLGEWKAITFFSKAASAEASLESEVEPQNTTEAAAVGQAALAPNLSTARPRQPETLSAHSEQGFDSFPGNEAQRAANHAEAAEPYGAIRSEKAVAQTAQQTAGLARQKAATNISELRSNGRKDVLIDPSAALAKVPSNRLQRQVPAMGGAAPRALREQQITAGSATKSANSTRKSQQPAIVGNLDTALDAGMSSFDAGPHVFGVTNESVFGAEQTALNVETSIVGTAEKTVLGTGQGVPTGGSMAIDTGKNTVEATTQAPPNPQPSTEDDTDKVEPAALLDRVELPVKLERLHRPELPPRVERVERIELPVKVERVEQLELPVKIERVQRLELPLKIELAR